MAPKKYSKKRSTANRKRKNYRSLSKGKTFSKKVMSVVNKYSDKKSINQTVGPGTIGQFQAVTATTFADGYSYIPLSLPSTGATDNSARIGNKIHMTGAQIRLQFWLQDNASLLSGQRIRIVVFRAKGNVLPSTPDFYLKNDAVYQGIGYLSDRNSDYITNYVTVCNKYYKMPLRNISNQATTLDVKLNLKLNHDVHFNGSAATSIADSQLFMILMCDSGNIGGVTYTNATPPFPVKTALTGLNYNASITQYYTDV